MEEKKHELVSVIVPIYKVEDDLLDCVTSIQNQTHTNLEIILVDDGSPDKCGEMCDVLAKDDDRIIVIHQENGGLSSARNAGMQVMKGDYITFVDSDDVLEKKFVENLLKLLHKYQAEVAVCQNSVFTKTRGVVHLLCVSSDINADSSDGWNSLSDFYTSFIYNSAKCVIFYLDCVHCWEYAPSGND